MTKPKPPINIAEMWKLEAYFENIQFNNWRIRYTKRHIFEEGLSEQESKVARGGERILFSELACIPDWYDEPEDPDKITCPFCREQIDIDKSCSILTPTTEEPGYIKYVGCRACQEEFTMPYDHEEHFFW